MKKERTFVAIKPDGVQRGLIGDVISRFERAGLKLVGLKMVRPEADLIERHYTVNPLWKKNVGEKSLEAYARKDMTPPSTDPIVLGEKVLHTLKTFMTAGPVVAMAWEGMHAVQVVRKLVGSTEPLTSDVGTIRGDFTIDSYQVSDIDGRAVRNIVHASGAVDEALAELALWFKENELLSYKNITDLILYDVNLDSIKD